MSADNIIKIYGHKVDIERFKEKMFPNGEEDKFSMDRILPIPPEFVLKDLMLAQAGAASIQNDDEFFANNRHFLRYTITTPGLSEWIERNGPVDTGLKAVEVLTDLRPAALDLGHQLILQKKLYPEYNGPDHWRWKNQGTSSIYDYYPEVFVEEELELYFSTEDEPGILAKELLDKWCTDHVMPSISSTWEYRLPDEDGEFTDDWSELY